MTKTITGYIRKDKSLHNHITRHKVINILRRAEMDNKKPAVEDANGKINATADERNDFFNTGRIGRRNALPDILGNHCTTSTAELPLLLDSLSTKDQPSTSEPGPSSNIQKSSMENDSSTKSKNN